MKQATDEKLFILGIYQKQVKSKRQTGSIQILNLYNITYASEFIVRSWGYLRGGEEGVPLFGSRPGAQFPVVYFAGHLFYGLKKILRGEFLQKERFEIVFFTGHVYQPDEPEGQLVLYRPELDLAGLQGFEVLFYEGGLVRGPAFPGLRGGGGGVLLQRIDRRGVNYASRPAYLGEISLFRDILKHGVAEAVSPGLDPRVEFNQLADKALGQDGPHKNSPVPGVVAAEIFFYTGEYLRRAGFFVDAGCFFFIILFGQGAGPAGQQFLQDRGLEQAHKAGLPGNDSVLTIAALRGLPVGKILLRDPAGAHGGDLRGFEAACDQEKKSEEKGPRGDLAHRGPRNALGVSMFRFYLINAGRIRRGGP